MYNLRFGQLALTQMNYLFKNRSSCFKKFPLESSSFFFYQRRLTLELMTRRGSWHPGLSFMLHKLLHLAGSMKSWVPWIVDRRSLELSILTLLSAEWLSSDWGCGPFSCFLSSSTSFGSLRCHSTGCIIIIPAIAFRLSAPIIAAVPFFQKIFLSSIFFYLANY